MLNDDTLATKRIYPGSTFKHAKKVCPCAGDDRRLPITRVSFF